MDDMLMMTSRTGARQGSFAAPSLTGQVFPDVRKIAVVRANALGDFIFVLPALAALRRSYPEAEIVYLGKAWHADFVPGRVRSIDRVAVTPPYGGVGEAEGYVHDEAAMDEFFYSMRGEHFDLAFQMHGGGRYSNPFVRQLDATWTIGARTPDAEALDISVPFSFYQNEVLRYLELASLAGATIEDIVPHLNINPHDACVAQQVTGDAKYVVIHPGASDPRRRWPVDRFAALARHFLDHENLPVFITGDGSEAALVDAVVQATDNRARSVCGVFDIAGLAGLLALAEVTISNDTGPLHLARAVNCPTVGLYWCGNYISAGPIRLDHHKSLLSWTTACPECGTPCVGAVPFRNTCSHEVCFIQDIPIDGVIEAAKAVIRQR